MLLIPLLRKAANRYLQAQTNIAFKMKFYFNFFFVVVFLLLGNLGKAQNIKINKRNVLKVFKRTIVQNKTNKISIPSNPWFIDNTADKFIESDTLKFTNSRTFNRTYCKVINWTFYKKDKIVRTFGDYCNEPPTEKVSTDKDYFDLKIQSLNSTIFLVLYNRKKLAYKFEIISLEKIQSISYKNELKYILTLKRVNNVPSAKMFYDKTTHK